MSDLIERLRSIAKLECEEYGASPEDAEEWKSADLIESQAQELANIRYNNAIIFGTSHPEMHKTELDYAKEEIAELKVNNNSLKDVIAYEKSRAADYKALCDQMGAALKSARDLFTCVETCSRNNFENLALEQIEVADIALTALRNMK